MKKEIIGNANFTQLIPQGKGDARSLGAVPQRTVQQFDHATSWLGRPEDPRGPWKIGGVLVDSRAPELNREGTAIQTTNGGHNTHGSIEQINGQWYVFYHRPPRGGPVRHHPG